MNIVRRTFVSTSTATPPTGRRAPNNLHFVPKHEPPKVEHVTALQNFVTQHPHLFVLTGAGVSTESGIPDYRSEDVGLFATSTQKPMKIQEFLGSPAARRRYWARNFFAWPRYSSFKPNIVHKTLREWELRGKVKCLVTQNVDGLHGKAGSDLCIELHGSGHRVMCLNCSYTVERGMFQEVLMELNSSLALGREGGQDQGQQFKDIRPDGDILIDQETQERFRVPPCPSCSGILKPDIVFFGDNVPKWKVELIYEGLKCCDGVLVLGSTLQTFSAFRYLLTAHQCGTPTAIVTLGATRADSLGPLKLGCRVGQILPLLQL